MAKKRPAAVSTATISGDTAKKTKQLSLNTFIVRQSSTTEERNEETGNETGLTALLKEPGWKKKLNKEMALPYFVDIERRLEAEYKKGMTVYPRREEIFSAFNLTPLDSVRVVILGQDPYHGQGQAHGLCFSVHKGIPAPPSLKNIFKELCTDIPHFVSPDHGCLHNWALQGILLLNATLTVQAQKANSHEAFGWQKFTDVCIKLVSTHCDGVVFILWGNFAHKKQTLIDVNKHIIIKTAHPSPLSAHRFHGSKCFSETNAALVKLGKPPIDWTL